MVELTLSLNVVNIKTGREILIDLKNNGFDMRRKIFTVIDPKENTVSYSQLERQNHRSYCNRR